MKTGKFYVGIGGVIVLFILSMIYSPLVAQVPGGENILTTSAGARELFSGLEERSRTDISQDQLHLLDSALLLPNIPYRGRFFRLAGWLGRTQSLLAVPFEYRQSTRLKNDYDLALIRTGDQSRISRLERLLREARVDDDFIYDIAPQLIYTRREEVFDFMLDQILLNQQNCSPADSHTSGRINCAYRLLEMVAPHIQDFPLQVGRSGDLEVEDYVSALGLARIWISENREDYRIITETY